MQNYNILDHIYSFGNQGTTGNLWLGDYTSSKSKKTHREKQISTVITAGLGMKVAPAEPIKHKLYPLYDSPVENIERFFDQAYDHIQMGLQQGNVLVHCFAGVSRSSTIVISYLMKKLNWSFKQALDHVRKQRWVVNPNPGFVRQLRRYETRLKQSLNPETEKLENNFFSTTLKSTKPLYISPKVSSKSTTMNRGSIARGNSLYGHKVNNSRFVNYSVAKR